MAFEIEHKYLVNNECYRHLATESHHIVQGYLSRERGRTVRVRTWDNRGYITIKSANVGATRQEFEYEIPIVDAQQLLQLCPPPVIDKTRHIVIYSGNRWEVDEFHGALAPLVTAEIELPDEGYNYTLPPFVGENVTGDRRYYNSQLGL